MQIMGIDIGWLHLAWVIVHWENNQIKIQTCRLINLNNDHHKKIPRQSCSLHHSNEMYDKIQHVVQEYKDDWLKVDKVLIERQPIQGLKCVEQFFFGYFRVKCELIHPTKMHKRLWPLKTFTYEQRKEEMVKLTQLYLQDQVDWQNHERQHDMADALGLIFYYLNVNFGWNEFRNFQLDPNFNWQKFLAPKISKFSNYLFQPNPLPIIKKEDFLKR